MAKYKIPPPIPDYEFQRLTPQEQEDYLAKRKKDEKNSNMVALVSSICFLVVVVIILIAVFASSCGSDDPNDEDVILPQESYERMRLSRTQNSCAGLGGEEMLACTDNINIIIDCQADQALRGGEFWQTCIQRKYAEHPLLNRYGDYTGGQ